MTMNMAQPAQPAQPEKTPDQLLDEHFYKCSRNFQYYARHNLKVLDADDSKLKPFHLHNVQRVLEMIWRDIDMSGRLFRLWILKARRQGLSTWTTGRLFWMTATRHNRNTVIIAHEPAATEFLFEMQKRYYSNLEPEMKPQTLRNAAKILQFNNEEGKGLDSAIRVGTAGVKDFGSGQGINYLLLSEAAKFPRETQDDLLTSVFQTVPATRDSAIIIESTAKGIGGVFYKGFNACRYVYEIYLNEKHEADWRMVINDKAPEDNEDNAVFIPWFAFDRYRRGVPDNFKRTPEEDQWVKQFNLEDAQLVWYRWVLTNKCRGDLNKRAQEYPFTAKGAFVGSGTPVFNVGRLMGLKADCKPPIARYECLTTTGTFIASEQGRIKVWEEPKFGGYYAASADVAEGLEHGDFDSVSIFDHETGVQVATFHGHMPVFEFAELLRWLGKRYNDAWLVPERNNNGLSVVEKLFELEYPNLYVEMVPDPPNTPRKRFGWVTSNKTRDVILNNLIHAMSAGESPIRDADYYDEMMNFKIINGRKEADPGTFDDRVLEIAIGLHAVKNLPYAYPEVTVTQLRTSNRPDMRAFRT